MGLFSALFGSKTKTEQQQQWQQQQQQNFETQNNIDPRLNEFNWQNLDALQGWAANYEPVTAPRPLDFNADQINAQDQIRNLGLPSAAYNQQQAAAQGKLAEFMNYQPQQVKAQQINAPTIDMGALAGYFSNAGGGGGTASTWDAAQGKAANINRGDIGNVGTQMAPEMFQNYLSMMDPSLQQNVIDASLKDIERSRAMAQQPNATAAAKAGAFGGSRQGVLEAETNRAYGDIGARTTADIRLAGYGQALNAAQTDLARKLQADLANQGVDVNVATNNAQLQQQMEMANMAGQNAARQSNATNQTNVSIAGAQSGNAAALARAQMLANATIQNAQMGLAAGQSNQSADLQGQQFNVNAGLQNLGLGTNAANSLYGNAQTGRENAISDADLLRQVGLENYNRDTAAQQTDYQNALMMANLPADLAERLLRAGVSVPYNTSQSGSSQGTASGTSSGTGTTTSTPSLMGGLTQLAGAASGIGGAVTGMLGGGMGGANDLLQQQLNNSGYWRPTTSLGLPNAPTNYR